MEATIVLVLFLTFVVGGMLLALVASYYSIEDSRSRRAQAQPGASRTLADAVVTHDSLGPAGGRVGPSPQITFDDALLAMLKTHVQAEQAAVSQFVHFPSVDSLYSKSGTSLRAH